MNRAMGFGIASSTMMATTLMATSVASAHERTISNSGPPSPAPSAAEARAAYSPTLIEEKCGASTSPTTRETPAATSSRAASSMNGGACFMPSTTSTSSWPAARSAAPRPAACARVISSSGERPPTHEMRRMPASRVCLCALKRVLRAGPERIAMAKVCGNG